MPRRNYHNKQRSTLHLASSTLDVASALDSSCRTKRRFHTEKIAQAAAEVQMLQHPDLTLGTYQCQQCRGWHLTRQSAEYQ